MLESGKMRSDCPHCGARLHLDAHQSANQGPAQVRCWMCSSLIELDSTSTSADPGPPTIEMNSSAPLEKSRGLAEALKSQTASLMLPPDTTIKISVISGPSQGLGCELSRPLMTIGRSGGGADIEIDDPEVSGLHCAVEVRRDAILLHDLHSRNGTYLGDSHVFAARLGQMSQFRIGSSLLQVEIIPKTEGSPK
jgi:predicted Zn finger-like uncharacterized protein